jgi:uncharacterized protein (DUF4213/DUF364 family)
MHAILAETAAEIEATLAGDLASITVTRAVIGVYFTAVALSTGTAGVCATPAKTVIHAACCPTTDDTVLPPGTLAGRPARALLAELDSPHPLRRVVGIATLNALAEACWRRRPDPGARLEEDIDGFDAAAIAPGEHVVLVGAFIPFLRALKQRRQDYTVLELTPAMLKPDELPHYRPASEAEQVLPRGDVVLLTGATLLDDALEALLAHTRADARVVVVGPTVGMLPGPLFRRNATIVGGVRVTDPSALLTVLAEGGSGQHFFGRSASRVVLRRVYPG